MTIQNLDKKRIITFFLPQFHPIEENNKWWGNGFTEWTNVTTATPLFEDHYQPHIPSELGFYDLRLSETRLQQEELAKNNGIFGFCYFHYWFNGKRLLNEPIDRKLNNEKEDLPYLLCWANENWTRRWDGLDNDILIKQDYSEEDDINHIEFLLSNHFNDKRYIRVNNKPFFIIYRPDLFPNIKKTISIWRKKAIDFGYDGLYLGYIQCFGLNFNPEDMFFDVSIEFPPHNLPLEPMKPSLFENLFSVLLNKKLTKKENRIINYNDYVKFRTSLEKPKYKFFPCVTPMWDNTARKKGKDGLIFYNSTPKLFENLLSDVYEKFSAFSNDENFIFINAWNEWGEGNHLEPCKKWGDSYLKAVKNISIKK